MSTRIHNGRILRNCSLAEALSKLQSLREECVRLAQSRIAMRVAKYRYFWADMNENFMPIPRVSYDSFYWRVLDLISAERIKVEASGERSVDWDFTFEILLIPFGDHVLAMHFLENNPGYTDLLSQVGFEDYHYQNSTDRPEDVPKDEWTARKNAWDQVLPTGIPAHAGLSFEMVSWQDIRMTLQNRELILTTRPDEAYRRRRVAMHLIDPAPKELGSRDMDLFQRAKLAQMLADERAPHVFLASDEAAGG